MAIKTRIDSVSRDIGLIVNDMLSPAAQGRAVAAFAREAIAEGDATNKRILGRVPPRTITVDGHKGAVLESVRPAGGSIVVEWEIVGDLLQWFADTLVSRSPRVSGDYIEGHTLFADGVEVPKGQQIPNASEFVFINLTPYARKIEVGKTKSGRDFVIQVSPRIYERTYRDGKARFGNQAKITFGYETQTGAYRLKHDQASRSWNKRAGRWNVSARQRADRVAGSAVSVPAIRISLKDL